MRRVIEEDAGKFLTKAALLEKYIKITAVVLLYWIVSILTVFVNKTLLNSHTVNLEAPLFVTWFQCVVSTIICFIISFFFRSDKFSYRDLKPLSIKYLTNVLPISVLFVLMIGFNNLCLSYVNVSFYFIGRALTTVFNVIFSYVILGQKQSNSAVMCCVVIVLGFWLGVDQESFIGSISVRGTIFGVLGSLFLSLYSVYTKRVLPVVNNEVLLLSFYNNFYSLFLFLPFMYLNNEFSSLKEYDFSNNIFWPLMIIGGLFGFSIGFVTTLQIKFTSPLTHNISGTAKACVQTVLATSWYNETKPVLWWFSNIVVLIGSACYTRIKQIEMNQSHREKMSLPV